MVVYKNGSYAINRAYPDTDFIGCADYVVPDGSELAEKIISLSPNFEIAEGDNGGIADVVAVEAEPVETVPEITDKQRLEAAENAIEEIINMLMGG